MSYNRSHLHGKKESKKQASETFMKLEKKNADAKLKNIPANFNNQLI